MAFSDTQTRQLGAKLDGKYVKSRMANGTELHYVEGWHAVAEANRIFGFDAWDRQTLATSCVWSGGAGEGYAAVYTAMVRIRVRAGDATILRDGSGSGEAQAPTRGQAHDLALKAAETDATKRALTTFGNPFGLALYDREQAGVRKPRGNKVTGPWIVRSASGTDVQHFDNPDQYAATLRKRMSEVGDIEALFAVWEINVDAVRAINRALKESDPKKSGVAAELVKHLKRCAVALVDVQRVSPPEVGAVPPPKCHSNGGRPKVDKSVLAIAEPKRTRSKEHLRFVASQPCVSCGRSPSHAHHVRFAQSRGVGLKVSDEFTVPLCAIHHHELHQTGKEQDWWRRRNIEPLAIALSLARGSRSSRLRLR
jgi:hypothetical protein